MEILKALKSLPRVKVADFVERERKFQHTQYSANYVITPCYLQLFPPRCHSELPHTDEVVLTLSQPAGLCSEEFSLFFCLQPISAENPTYPSVIGAAALARRHEIKRPALSAPSNSGEVGNLMLVGPFFNLSFD